MAGLQWIEIIGKKIFAASKVENYEHFYTW
jgi:hypothetical protein